MPTLRECELELVRALLSGGVTADSVISENMTRNTILPADVALSVYRNNIRVSKINALMQIYPACCRILGENVFRSIGKEYGDKFTNYKNDLNQYGEMLNIHLHALIAARRLPVDYSYLPDLSMLEYRLHQAYYAQDDEEFDFNHFENTMLSGKDLFIVFSHAFHLLRSDYPVFELWSQNISNREDVEAVKNTGTEYLVIYRDNFTPMVSRLSNIQYMIMKKFLKGDSLQQAINKYGNEVAINLPLMIRKKWVVGVCPHG